MEEGAKLAIIFEQNWQHIRHIENQRILCLNAYIAMLAAGLTLIEIKNLVVIASHMFIIFYSLSVINFLLSLKYEAVINDYSEKNKEIIFKGCSYL